MTKVTNDNGASRHSPQTAEPDAYGLAAILLVESLLHALIARSVFTAADAIALIDVALDVKVEIGVDRGGGARVMDAALSHLAAIQQSIGYDVE